MSPEVFGGLMFGWAMIGLPITIVISLWAVSAWAIYRVVLGGRLDFWSWSERMINRK